MAKRIKKFTVLMAIMMCLTIGVTNVMPVKAAPMPERAWACSECQNPFTVEVKNHVYQGKTQVRCELREHLSLSCKIEYDVYADEYWITCSHCGKSYRQNTENYQYVNGVHKIL